jgi:hypothetical protein
VKWDDVPAEHSSLELHPPGGAISVARKRGARCPRFGNGRLGFLTRCARNHWMR